MKKIILILPILACLTLNAQVTGKKTLPEVKIKDISGKVINVSDYGKSGKLTVISFWATWCAPCKKELNNISELYEEWKGKYNLEIVGVSIDDSRNAAKVKSYADGQGWTFPVLIDENQELKRALNFQSVPFTLIVDPTGEIVYQHNGYVEGDEFVLEDKIKSICKK